jgi:hypothetical protein
MIEPNTFRKREDCCKIRYFIEKNRLRESFADFEILYYYEYYEGCAPDKHKEVPEQGVPALFARIKIKAIESRATQPNFFAGF